LRPQALVKVGNTGHQVEQCAQPQNGAEAELPGHQQLLVYGILHGREFIPEFPDVPSREMSDRLLEFIIAFDILGRQKKVAAEGAVAGNVDLRADGIVGLELIIVIPEAAPGLDQPLR